MAATDTQVQPAIADDTSMFELITRRARWCPPPLWWLSAGRPFVVVKDHRTNESTLSRVRWGHLARIAVGPAGATVDVSYYSRSWGDANKAHFTAVPGDVVEYRATWWPWQRGRFVVHHADSNE